MSPNPEITNLIRLHYDKYGNVDGKLELGGNEQRFKIVGKYVEDFDYYLVFPEDKEHINMNCVTLVDLLRDGTPLSEYKGYTPTSTTEDILGLLTEVYILTFASVVVHREKFLVTQHCLCYFDSLVNACTPSESARERVLVHLQTLQTHIQQDTAYDAYAALLGLTEDILGESVVAQESFCALMLAPHIRSTGEQ